AVNEGRNEEATRLYEASLAIHREIGNQWGIALVLNNLGEVCGRQGDFAQARRLQEDSLMLRRALGHPLNIAYSLSSLGDTARRQGEYGAARAYHRESLEQLQELGHKSGIVDALESLAALETTESQPQRAAKLLGAAEALRESLSTPLPPASRA